MATVTVPGDQPALFADPSKVVPQRLLPIISSHFLAGDVCDSILRPDEGVTPPKRTGRAPSGDLVRTWIGKNMQTSDGA